jgi:site-specific DNA-methyltransferase (adenine-specific)
MISEVYNEDCMAVMARYPDKYFDLAVVDPPYGIGASRPTGHYARNQLNYTAKTDKKWDTYRPAKEYFLELFRISQNQVIWGANYFSDLLPPSKGWCVWYKTDELKGRDFSEAELAFTSFNMRCLHFEQKPFIRNNNRIHPTQKPVALYDWIFKNYAKPTDKILDTHLGSGSSRIAAHKAKLDFVGCELDKEYFEAADKRYKLFASQLTMF